MSIHNFIVRGDFAETRLNNAFALVISRHNVFMSHEESHIMRRAQRYWDKYFT